MVTPRNLFAKPDLPQSGGRIILWWEARRLHYNVIILAWVMVLVCIEAARLGRFDGELWSFNLLFLYLLFFQLPANIWYTGGWIVDLVVKKIFRLPARGFGPWTRGTGIALSLAFYLAIFVYVLTARPRGF